MGFAEFMGFEGGGVGSSGARDSVRWVGTIFALISLILNRTGRRSGMQSNLLVMFLFTSFPTVLFKILRGQFGYWVSFLAVSANLFFPQTFPVSRFLLFVVTPTWVANGLRDSIVGGIFCLIIGVLSVITGIQESGGFSNCECNCHCFAVFVIVFVIVHAIFIAVHAVLDS
ncbi:cold-regulated 413 plasma membrane protein 4-like [Rosa rugosa]|uniref:cold-regulated 413 plasma membrane protein 4-like n=1 Tax=Rosa rugosa TaxID=74645 RepID=UPI002B407D43|nr:cold-regulated 413 plasma membrane protein 4-like [Rosa rugosa]